MSYFIYKIVCEDLTDFVYVGSTKAFRQRKAEHKSRVNTRDTILYKTIRDNGGWENWRMVCIEECDNTIDSKRKAEAREEEWRQKLNANLNTKKCLRTREEKLQYNLDYNKNNIEAKREADRKYKKTLSGKKFACNCGCGKELSKKQIYNHLNKQN